MDILLSLPIASYFFSSVTSWSTSVNLLFFYMTWSTLILSHSPLKIELIGTTALRILFGLTPSLVFLLFDTLLPSLSEGIKYNGASALPPRDAKSIAKLISLALFNLALETALEAGLSLGLTVLLKTPPFHTATTLPLPWQMAKHIALLFAARELLTYYIHRNVLHAHSSAPISKRKTKAPTQRIATLHHKYAHAHSAPPFSLLLLADHPFPFLLHRFIPLYLPAIALHNRLHLLTFFIFVALCTMEETLAMSGYTVVPGILMGGITRRSAVHYAKPAGNYGCWGILDWVHGTSLGGDVMADVRDEAKKHRVKERSAKKADNAGGMVQNGIEGLRRSARSRGRRSQS
ncbi:sterol desaturase family protein [Bombardia bombarda]|uniref:Sterol desaturase family protein n=1 Tax=Bombardia bombarda TaxID=252184 RepID=A0AA39XMG5_9PEZI|nr:sterol desaturase family protein [Bombardia bombarda]